MRNKISTSISKRVAKFGRLIPILSGLITLYSFAEDAEAHGVGGAIARATPLLGDVIAAYDLGNDLAMLIVTSAVDAADATIREVNPNVKSAHEAATKAAVDAYNEFAKSLRITSPYIQTSDDVANVVADAISEFYSSVYPVYLKRYQSGFGGSIPSDAEIESRIDEAKRNMRDHLQQNHQSPSTPSSEPRWSKFG